MARMGQLAAIVFICANQAAVLFQVKTVILIVLALALAIASNNAISTSICVIVAKTTSHNSTTSTGAIGPGVAIGRQQQLGYY